MKVTVSILTYNRACILDELLGLLTQILYEDLEIIVVDNHSTDGTDGLLNEKYPDVKCFRMDRNIGVAARNVGLRNAAGDVVVTLDDDIIGIDRSDIETIQELFISRQEVGAVCFKVKDYYTGSICNWCHHYKKEEYADNEFVTDEISEGAVAFRKSALEASGFYPENFFISYEGADILCKLLRVGYLTIYCPEITVYHKHAQESRPSWRRYYFDTRNQIWFVARNYPLLHAMKYLLRGLPVMLLYSVRDGFFLYWMRGVVHAVQGLPEAVKERRPLNQEAMSVLKAIAINRPGVMYMLKERLFQKGVSI